MSNPRPVNRLRTAAPQPASSRSGRSPRVDSLIRQRPWLLRVGQLLIKLLLLALLISFGWVVLLKYLPVSITPLMISRKMEAKAEGHDSKLYKDWTPYEEISKEAALAVVASEDQAFPRHWGFDFDEIQDAIKENKTRKRPRGASTISQQVAKNVFLWNGRSYLRKGLEVYFTFLIELIWGKERILEVYLNVAETGPLTFGVEAASRRYYGHAAKYLTRTEAARIAAVLPNPRLFSIKKPSAYTQKRTRQISRQMRYLGGRRYLENL
ncbi:monofunctional biosynthetic peptidoglycan transglycosylase [Larkinella insperata]|uniref:Biosynthetic peptidoglycan transglycosylase n=1 Tax=Larkinella insperata TaxID=332158 RepID=A0ABW3Q8Z4_9BACT|nr:monofunctional biosynthetic peptidoglycan transglycosylase [Larkinella insperata]